jgi:peptidyl-prolyl cis-trans isomerase D
LVLVGCKSNWPKPNFSFAKQSDAVASPKAPKTEPDYIKVQHCLIGFSGSVPGKSISRTKEEAQTLATQLLSDLRAGADFDEVIRKNTNDSPPGIYKMANYGKMAIGKGTFERDGMVPAFGNTGFPLQVGEFGLAEYDSRNSPYGWHIIKRIE